MPTPLDQYRWEDHVPALGLGDLTIAVVVSLALMGAVVFDWPREGPDPIRHAIGDAEASGLAATDECPNGRPESGHAG